MVRQGLAAQMELARVEPNHEWNVQVLYDLAKLALVEGVAMRRETSLPEWQVQVESAGGERHLPIYLLLDISMSMDGAPIEAVRAGLEQFQQEVADDPFAREAVLVGIITFSSSAQLLGDQLFPIAEWSTPELAASGVTRLDLAFWTLLESMDRDVYKPLRGGRRGDFHPIIFVLTDGRPTDEHGYESDTLWPKARNAIVERPTGFTKPNTIVAMGCGPHVDDETLKSISTGTAFHIGTSQAAFAALFQYVSQSVVSSAQPGGNPQDPFANFPPPPGIVRIP